MAKEQALKEETVEATQAPAETITDPDLLRLQEATKAVEDEEKAAAEQEESDKAGAQEEQPEQSAPVGQEPPIETGDPETDNAPVTIPYSRFAQVVAESKKAKEEALTTKAQLEAAQRLIATGAPVTPAQMAAITGIPLQSGKTTGTEEGSGFKEAHGKLDADLVALAEKHENGDISFRDYEKQRLEIENQRRLLDRKEMEDRHFRQQMATIEDRTQEIVDSFPTLNAAQARDPEQTKRALDGLMPVAIRETEMTLSRLSGRKVSFAYQNPEHHVALRFQLARLWDYYNNDGRDFTALLQAKGELAPSSDATSQPAGKPKVAPTPAQRGLKADLAASMPPNLTTIPGGKDTPIGSVFDGIDKMNTEQISDLQKRDPSAIERFLRT